MSPRRARRVINGSHGSPFLFQLLGEAAWNAGTSALISQEEATRGRQSAAREMQRYVRLRLGTLTDLQMSYLQATADLPQKERTSALIAQSLGRTSAQLGSTARALEERYRLIRRQSGVVVFTSPGLEAYLRGSLV